MLKEDKVKKCVEEDRDKGEIKKTKGEENVAEKKKKKKRICCVGFGYMCGVGQWHDIFYLFLVKVGLWKKKLY